MRNHTDHDIKQPDKPVRPIRFPVDAKGHFEPVSVKKWLGAYSINVPNMHQFDKTGSGQMLKRK